MLDWVGSSVKQLHVTPECREVVEETPEVEWRAGSTVQVAIMENMSDNFT